MYIQKIFPFHGKSVAQSHLPYSYVNIATAMVAMLSVILIGLLQMNRPHTINRILYARAGEHHPSNTAVWLIRIDYLMGIRQHNHINAIIQQLNFLALEMTGEMDIKFTCDKTSHFHPPLMLASKLTHWVFRTRVSVVSKLSMTSNSMLRRITARRCLSTSLWKPSSWACSVGMLSVASWSSGFWWW